MEINMTLDELLETDQGECLNAVEATITPQATLTDIVSMIEANQHAVVGPANRD